MKKVLSIIFYVIGGIFIAAMFASCAMRVSYGLAPEWGVFIFGVVIGGAFIIIGRKIRPKN